MVYFIVFCILLLGALYFYGALLNGRAATVKAARLREARAKLELAKPNFSDALVKSSLSFVVETGYRRTEGDEEFEKWLTREFGESVDKHFYSKVAGVSFENRDGSSRQSLVLQCGEYDRIMLVREPENPHGSTAVRVENAAGLQLGYLPHNISAEIFDHIDQWMAVVRQVHPRSADMPAALVICLVRCTTIDNSEGAIFEKAFMLGVGKHSDLHFHARMDRAYGLNEDGADRQELIAKCRPYQALHLRREPENSHDSNSVQVCNEAGQKLGYLERRSAAEIAPQLDAGRLWGALVRNVEPTPSGKRSKLHLCVYRLTPEYAQEVLSKKD